MTTTEILTTLAREYPNGVSFDPMAMRLLRQKIPFEDWQIRNIQAELFQLENGLWFSTEMISKNEVRLALCEQAKLWLIEHSYFSVEQLFSSFRNVISNLATTKDFAAFLRHLRFSVAKGGRGDSFCLLSSTSLEECLTKTSKAISKQLEEAGGILAFSEIALSMPHLTIETLHHIREQFLLEVCTAELRGIPCWCSTEAIPLPEDFPERLTTAVDTLVMLEEKVSVTKLEFALNLFYCTRFRKEYALQDKDTFMRVCSKHYQGENDVFPNEKQSRAGENGWSMPGKRLRSPNTTFRNLGIPIGAKLVYTKDIDISCTVLDDFNQVEYAGKAWAISTLATHLLGVSSVNGYRLFSYQGEVLWDRRSRIGLDKHDEYQASETPISKVQEVDEGVIGLEGRVLSPKTWQSFKYAGTRPQIAEWAQRLADGEDVKGIADESGLKAEIVKQYIGNRRRYFSVCRKNGIVPEGGVDV